MNRVRDIPPLRSMPYKLDAALYNQARLGVLRLCNPLMLELENLAIDLVLEDSCWTGYHYMQIALPLIAFDGFDTARSSLDAPVGCTLHLFHHHSWLQLPRILLALDAELRKQLAAK
jgi:hypothetical protein